MYQTSQSKGQELVAQRMVREFNRLGHSAYLITSGYNDWEPVITEDEISKRGGYVHLFDEKLGVPVVRTGSEVPTWPPRRIQLRNFVGTLTQVVSDLKLNVLITHSTLWNGPEDAAKFVAWKRRLSQEGAYNQPILFCQMSHFQEASDERYTLEERSFRHSWNTVSLKEIMRQADFVIVTTPLEAEQMKSLGADDGKIVLFPGGIDDEIFDSGRKASVRKRYGIAEKAKIVTFLGTVEERKNVLTLMEVAKTLTPEAGVHFVVAGRLEGEYGNQVKTACSSLKNVTLTGEITDDEKAQLIEETYANITMSRSEALGITQLEFMFRGVPVITSGVGGQSWVVRNGDNGIVVAGPDDVQGAVTGVRSLLENPSYRARLSDGAFRTSSQATLSKLVADLSKRLMRKLSAQLPSGSIDETREKLVEARVMGGKRVAVTSKRLIMSSTSWKKRTVSVPFAEITRVLKKRQRHRLVPMVGVLISAAVFAAERLAPAIFASVFGPLTSWASNWQFQIGVAIVPALVSVAVFLATMKDGYMVYYGRAQKFFLEREFSKVLRIADSLTENKLLSMSLDELEPI